MHNWALRSTNLLLLSFLSAFFIDLRKKIDLPVSSLFDIPFEASSTRDVIDNVIIKPPLPNYFAQPYEFQEDKESEGDDSIDVDK